MRIMRKIIILTVIIIVSVGLGLTYKKDVICDFVPSIDDTDNPGEYLVKDMALDPGDYGITLQYDAKSDTDVEFYLDYGDRVGAATLESGYDEYYFEQHLDEYTDTIHFVYVLDDPDDFKITNIRVEGKRSLYTDRFFSALLFMFAAAYCVLFFGSQHFIEKPLTEKVLIVIVHLAIVLVSLPLCSKELFWGDDIPSHVMRLEGVKDALRARQFPVVIYPKNDNGYGLLGFMYPCLFLYAPALIRLLRASIPFSMNLLFFLINVITAVTAYISGKILFRDFDDKLGRLPAYVFTIIYLMLPYRLVDIYTRADVGEALAVSFIPLVLAGVYLCISGGRADSCLAVLCLTTGMTGIIHSHILSSVILVSLAIVYAVIFAVEMIKNGGFRPVLISVIAVLFINIGYIIPFVTFYSFGLNISDMTHKVYIGQFSVIQLLGIYDFSSSKAWGGISVIGVCGLLLFAIWCAITLFRRKEHREINITDKYMIVSTVIALVLFITVPSEFPWDALMGIDIVKKITGILQFSFRIMLVAAPMLTMITVYSMYRIVSLTPDNMQNRWKTVLISGLITVAAVCAVPSIIGEINAEPYLQRLSGGFSRKKLEEYWPAGVESGVFSDDRVYWSSERLLYNGYEKDGVNVKFNYDIDEAAEPGSDTEWLEPPVLYYPGYDAVATDKLGNRHKLKVSQGDYYRARVDLPVSLAGSDVVLFYGGTWYFYVGYIISTISLLIFIIVSIRSIR